MKLSKEEHKCEEKVHKNWHRHQCQSKAKFLEGGKWYCGTHAPSRIKARAENTQRERNLVAKEILLKKNRIKEGQALELYGKLKKFMKPLRGSDRDKELGERKIIATIKGYM